MLKKRARVSAFMAVPPQRIKTINNVCRLKWTQGSFFPSFLGGKYPTASLDSAGGLDSNNYTRRKKLSHCSRVVPDRCQPCLWPTSG